MEQPQTTSAGGKKPSVRKPSVAVDRASEAFKNTLTAELGDRPYILESAAFEAEMHRQRDAATSEIEAIDAAITDINTRAERDIAAIQQRAASEIAGRNQRVDDLHKILAMTARALDLPNAPVIEEAQS